MKNAGKAIILITIITQITVQTSCVKEPLYDTDHPNHGKITLTTTWDERSETVYAPVSYTAKIGGYSTALQGITNSVDNLFPAGRHDILIYNEAENISVSGTTATANYAAGEIGWLFTGKETVDVEKDKDYHVTVAMRQQVRQLTLKFDITGDARDRISGVDATLSGVAGAINIGNGNPEGNPVTVPLSFEALNTPGSFAAIVRLLGITGTGQILSLTLHFADDNPRSFTLTSDLSDALAAFNAEKKTPLTLTSGITVTITQLGVAAEIANWEGGGNETIIAE
jgi:hypothetical protein